MLRVLFLLLLLPMSALAGAPRYHTHTLTIASAGCPTGTPGLAPDGVEWGISLSGLHGFKITVCPAAGQTITGAGSLKMCTYSPAPWGPGQWALSVDFTISMSGKTSTLANPCIEFAQLQPVVALSDRVFVYPSTDFGVSGGGPLTVYLTGELR